MASISILLPTALRDAASGRSSLTVEALTVSEALTALTSSHPQIGRMIFGADGRVRPHVHLFVGDRPVTGASDSHESLYEGDELRIVPAISGG